MVNTNNNINIIEAEADLREDNHPTEATAITTTTVIIKIEEDTTATATDIKIIKAEIPEVITMVTREEEDNTEAEEEDTTIDEVVIIVIEEQTRRDNIDPVKSVTQCIILTKSAQLNQNILH